MVLFFVCSWMKWKVFRLFFHAENWTQNLRVLFFIIRSLFTCCMQRALAAAWCRCTVATYVICTGAIKQNTLWGDESSNEGATAEGEVSNGEWETGRGGGKFHTSEFLTRFGRLGCLSTVQRFKLAMQFVLNYLQHCCKTRDRKRGRERGRGEGEWLKTRQETLQRRG